MFVSDSFCLNRLRNVIFSETGWPHLTKIVQETGKVQSPSFERGGKVLISKNPKRSLSRTIITGFLSMKGINLYVHLHELIKIFLLI